jgi:glycosyltransferase involved in cell wall biosynthesis
VKVLLISHTCQSATEGQPRAQHLGLIKDLELRVVIPDRWKHYGRWRSADSAGDASFHADVQPVRWPWLGPAQFYLHWYPGLSDVLTDFQPDIIDLWEEPWALVSLQACRLRNRLLPRAKIVSETEQNIFKKLPSPFEQIRSYVLRNADFVIGRSSEAVEVIRRKGYRGSAQTIPNGVDPAIFRPMDREQCRRELGISGFLVGYIGRLVPEKGLFDLVEAVSRCPADVHAIFVGDGPLKEKLLELGDGPNLRNRIHVLPARPLKELPRLMNALDVLALPSHTTGRWKEQFGRVIIEAHACGLPVIGTSSGAIPEVVGNGGLIVPEGDPTQLAAAMMKLFNDPALRAAQGAEGRLAVAEQCTWQRIAERMHAIYHRVLSAEPALWTEPAAV